MNADSMYFCEQFGQLGNKYTYTARNASVIRSKECEKNRSAKAFTLLVWIGEWLRYAFLPQGFPASVSSDYLRYQLWDTLQAFCSYLSGTLTTKAVMQGVGVGDAAATPLAATITWIMRDGTGMIGRIVFASWKGPSLDANCKQWRLAADILNDMAMTIELCSPMLPVELFPWALCLATSMKSIVGVAGGATRAALTQHQACRGNMADVAAKDGSQETLVNLIASMIGIVMLPLLTTDFYAWVLFFFFTCIHLFANYKAVRCLNIPILNEQRFNLLLVSFLSSSKGKIDQPFIINSKESVFIGTGMQAKDVCGFNIKLGASLSNIPDVSPDLLKFVCNLSTDYLVLPSYKSKTINVIFHHEVPPSPLKSYFHAVTLGLRLDQLIKKQMKQYKIEASTAYNEVVFQALSRASDIVANDFALFIFDAEQSGWVMSKHQLLIDEWQAEWHLASKKIN